MGKPQHSSMKEELRTADLTILYLESIQMRTLNSPGQRSLATESAICKDQIPRFQRRKGAKELHRFPMSYVSQ